MTVATLDDLGIDKVGLAEFVNDLIERNGGVEAEALQILYLKTVTAAEILRKALGCDPVQVTVGDDEV